MAEIQPGASVQLDAELPQEAHLVPSSPDGPISFSSRQEFEHAAIQMFEQKIESIEISQTLSIGPIPDPQVLAAYDSVVPGLAREIADGPLRSQARQDREQEVRLELERSAMRLQWHGLYLGFTLCLFLAGSGVYLLASGKDVGGFAALIASVASVAGIFVFKARGRAEQAKEDNSGNRPQSNSAGNQPEKVD